MKVLILFWFIVSFLFADKQAELIYKEKNDGLTKKLKEKLYFEYLYIDFYNYIIEHNKNNKIYNSILLKRSQRTVELKNILSIRTHLKTPTMLLDGGINYNNKNVNGMFLELKKNIFNKKSILSFMCIIENSSFYGYEEIYEQYNDIELYLSSKIKKYSKDSDYNLKKINIIISVLIGKEDNCCTLIGIDCHSSFKKNGYNI